MPPRLVHQVQTNHGPIGDLQSLADLVIGDQDRYPPIAQFADDLLDVQGDSQQDGKRVNKDAARGKLTFPSLLGVRGTVEYLLQLVDESCRTLEPFGVLEPERLEMGDDRRGRSPGDRLPEHDADADPRPEVPDPARAPP